MRFFHVHYPNMFKLMENLYQTFTRLLLIDEVMFNMKNVLLIDEKGEEGDMD